MAFPKIDACVICEGARPEMGGKHVLLGFFGIAPYVTIRLTSLQLPATVCFVFCGGHGEGRYRIELRITDAVGRVLLNTMPNSFEGEILSINRITNVYFQFVGIMSSEGPYRVSLFVNGTEHYFTTLNIAQMPGGKPN